MKIYDILIAGSGPAGITAAIYAARANKTVGLIMGLTPGGQLTKTSDVENYPGFADPIQGPELMKAMIKQAENNNVFIINDEVKSFEKKENFEIKGSSENYSAKSLIIATGAEAKLIGIEDEFWGFGISACATCDGSFFKGQSVIIIGGGNTALEEAIYLSNIAKHVTLIHRRNEFRGEQVLQERMKSRSNITIKTPYMIKEFTGSTKPMRMLKGAILENTQTGVQEEIKCDGAFIAIGHKPNTDFLNGMLDLDDQGYIKGSIKTKIPGLFIAGDVFDSQYRQAVTAAGFGCMAALDALKWIENNS
jgi:thioredoxin reductase (NADPH)